eukprot:scaffold256071_cov32-Tisochrysis_lutea.AAC.3
MVMITCSHCNWQCAQCAMAVKRRAATTPCFVRGSSEDRRGAWRCAAPRSSTGWFKLSHSSVHCIYVCREDRPEGGRPRSKPRPTSGAPSFHRLQSLLAPMPLGESSAAH